MNDWDKKIRSGSKIQSIIFKKRYWNTERAKRWLREHNFEGLKVDETQNYLRFRQEDPSEFGIGSYRTINLTKSIKAVVGIPYRNNRGESKVRKTIQFQKVFVFERDQRYDWTNLPIQYSTSSNVYFQVQIKEGNISLFSVNQQNMPCNDLAMEGSLADFLDLPREVKNLPVLEQIAWWNNHISMIYFKNEPVKYMPLFGRTETNNYYYREGVLYLHTVQTEFENVIYDEHTKIWEINDEEDQSPLFLIEETDDMQVAIIGINRRYLQGMMTKAMR